MALCERIRWLAGHSRIGEEKREDPEEKGVG
jgi:hypothetical protein